MANPSPISRLSGPRNGKEVSPFHDLFSTFHPGDNTPTASPSPRNKADDIRRYSFLQPAVRPTLRPEPMYRCAYICVRYTEVCCRLYVRHSIAAIIGVRTLGQLRRPQQNQTVSRCGIRTGTVSSSLGCTAVAVAVEEPKLKCRCLPRAMVMSYPVFFSAGHRLLDWTTAVCSRPLIARISDPR